MRGGPIRRAPRKYNVESGVALDEPDQHRRGPTARKPLEQCGRSFPFDVGECANERIVHGAKAG